MSYSFDTLVERRGTAAVKWARYADDVLPMWVADMDFAVAPEIAAALAERVAHPVFGYGIITDALRQRIVDDMAERYAWTIRPDDIVFLPGVVPGFNLALSALLQPGDGVTVQTPAYPPILAAPGHWHLKRHDVELLAYDGRYVVDMEAMTSALDRSRALLLCNPHNPTGRVFERDELAAIAAAVVDRDAYIISDEIHCDIVYGGHRHIPVATLGPEVAARTITLMAASKTYNVAGLQAAFAIITDAKLRHRFTAAQRGLVERPNVLGLEATYAAFSQGTAWKADLVAYLEANRDHLASEMARRFPGIRMLAPEGTFLAWLDCSALELGPSAQAFFLDKGRVAFNPGTDYLSDKSAFVRLNFGCPRALLDDGLNRMAAALSQR